MKIIRKIWTTELMISVLYSFQRDEWELSHNFILLLCSKSVKISRKEYLCSHTILVSIYYLKLTSRAPFPHCITRWMKMFESHFFVNWCFEHLPCMSLFSPIDILHFHAKIPSPDDIFFRSSSISMRNCLFSSVSSLFSSISSSFLLLFRRNILFCLARTGKWQPRHFLQYPARPLRHACAELVQALMQQSVQNE